MKYSDSLISSKHPSIDAIADIQEIAKPLFMKSKIEMFSYCRYYTDGFIWLNSSTNWHQFIFKKHIMLQMRMTSYDHMYDHMQHLMAQKEKQRNSEKVWIVAREYNPRFTNIIRNFSTNSMEIIGASMMDDNAIETFAFASSTQEATTYFLNHQDIFEQFIPYFKERSKALIAANEKNKIILPNEKSKSNNILRTNRHPLQCGKNLFYITQREWECLRLVAKGMTYGATGNILSIGSRTVEKHIEKAKFKTHAHSRTQLIKIFWNNEECSEHQKHSQIP